MLCSAFVIHMSVGGYTVKQAKLYIAVNHRLISWRATFRCRQMCWCLVTFIDKVFPSYQFHWFRAKLFISYNGRSELSEGKRVGVFGLNPSYKFSKICIIIAMVEQTIMCECMCYVDIKGRSVLLSLSRHCITSLRSDLVNRCHGY